MMQARRVAGYSVGVTGAPFDIRGIDRHPQPYMNMDIRAPNP